MLEQYSIYLTDLNKLFVRSEGGRKLHFSKAVRARFEECLRIEIETVEPELIVTFGGPARDAIAKMGLKQKSLALTHPRAWAGNWVARYNISRATHEAKVAIMIQETEKMLSLNEYQGAKAKVELANA